MNILPLKKSLEEESPQQRLTVLLALAAGQGQTAEACPPAERLVALLEGRLPERERPAMLQHLDQCPACYRAWLGTAALHPPQVAGGLLFFRRSPPMFALGGLALAASLFLVLVRWDPFAPDLPGMLTTAYQTALLQGVKPVTGQRAPVSSQEGATALGFTGQGGLATTPVRQAFLLGAQSGWALAQGQEPPLFSPMEKGVAVYHHLGRWTTLLNLLCQTPPAPATPLLRQQAQIGEAMAAVLAAREAKGETDARIPRQEMEKINLLLGKPFPDEAAPRLCRQIQTSLTTIAESLSL
ncbi:MAG: zf-HC2 domain-containing protein [Magnetococcus sp. YQC-3]